MNGVFSIFAGLLGLCVGSFLNVVSWRVPLGKSIVSPPSACPGCGKRIDPADNVPVVSYLLLRGRCRGCGMRISPRYPVTELATGVLFLLAAMETGYSPAFITHAVLISLMVITVRTDIEQFIVLDQVSIGGTAAGIGLSLIPGGIGIVDSLAAALGSFVFFLLIRVGASAYMKNRNIRTPAPQGYETEEDEFQGGMGWGDIKLAACTGAFLGPAAAAVAFFSAFILGAFVGGGLLLLGRKRNVPIPFGPFMAVGALISLFFGETLWRGYTGLFPY